MEWFVEGIEVGRGLVYVLRREEECWWMACEGKDVRSGL